MKTENAIPPAELEERLRFETLIADLSSKFVNLPAAEVDREIEDALRRVCELLGIDLAVLWQWSGAAPGVAVPTHAYCVQQDLRPSEPMREDQYPWATQQMLAGRMFALSSLEEYPAEAAVDRETCRQFGIKAGVCLPLAVGGERPIGALGLNALRAERDWPSALVNRLQLFAQIFANALARKQAQENAARLLRHNELILNSAAEGILGLDLGGNHSFVNPAAARMLGYEVEELLGRHSHTLWHHTRADGSPYPEQACKIYASFVDGKVHRESNEVFWRKDGTCFPVEYASTPIYEQGRLLGAVVTFEDITERKRAEEKVRQLTHAMEHSPVSVVITDLQGTIIYVNRKFSEVSGYAFAECIGQNPRILKSGECPPSTYRELWACITGGGTWRGEFHNRKKNGELYWEWAVISPLPDATGKATHFVGVKEDITARKQTEAVMHDLSRRLIRAHEAERARLARELHDDVTQRLARLAIDAGRAERGADEVSPVETMRSLREGLVRLSEDIHALSYRLHPSVLEDLGLAEALKAECERFSRQESLPAHVTLSEVPDDVPPETALCLFRVVQEALRNVARHAQARRVEVTVRALDGGLQLAVLDDGIGFDPALQRSRPSLGLASMRERVLLLGGELDIESAAGHGTTILVSVPLNKSEG